MRRVHYILIFAALLFVGCQAECTIDNTANKSTTLSIKLAPTRTSIGAKEGELYPAYWSKGDRISVNGHLSEEALIGEDSSTANFTINGTLTRPYCVTYPHSASSTAEQAVVEFPTLQHYTESSFESGAAPMCGYSEGGESIALSHLAAILRLSVKAKSEGVKLERIVITSEAAIAGEFAVDCPTATITPTNQSQKSITYSLPSSFSLSSTSESVFYISLAAVDAGRCKIEFIEASGHKMVATWSPSTTLSKGVVREFKSITYERDGATTLEPLEVMEDDFTIYYKKVYGHIRYSDGSPIAGVAVSDGFQVVTTNEEGYYEMEGVTPQSWYIYCSMPADVVMPIDEFGRPCFFQKYPSNSPRYDFTFERLVGGKEREFSIFAIADTQPTGQAHLERFRLQIAPEIKSHSKSLNTPCYGVVLGDLVGSVPSFMDDMRAELEPRKVGMPIFAVMGNHDHVLYSASDPLFPDERNHTFMLKVQRDFEECFGPVNFSFNRGDVHIVGMRNVRHKDNLLASNYETAFTTEQFEWLKKDLALVPKDKMVVLCVHIPILNGGRVGDGTYRQEVLNMMDQYAEAHILSGHTHYMRPYDHVWYKTGHKIYEHCIASTRYDRVQSNIHRDGTPCGYAVLKVKDNAFVDWYYKGAVHGMNTRDKQMRLYRGGSVFGTEPTANDKAGTMGYYQLPFNGNTLLANIFSSDPSWNVEVYEDGVYSGKMTYFYNTANSGYDELVGTGVLEDPRRVADGVACSRDFWAIAILFGYCGSSVDNNYNTCYTMWQYTLKNPNAKHIEVRATDRFGYLYKEDHIEDNSDLGCALYDPALNPPLE